MTTHHVPVFTAPAPGDIATVEGAQPVRLVHAIGNDVVIALCALSAFLRYRADEYASSPLAPGS